MSTPLKIPDFFRVIVCADDELVSRFPKTAVSSPTAMSSEAQNSRSNEALAREARDQKQDSKMETRCDESIASSLSARWNNGRRPGAEGQ